MKLPSGITAKFGRQVLLFKKNSPTLMFGAGVATAVTATVLACKSTLALEDTLVVHENRRGLMDNRLADETDTDYTQSEYKHDDRIVKILVVRDVAKLYAPAVGLGVISIGLLTGAHVTLTKRNAAAIAAYNILDKGFKEYRSRIREEFGEDKERELYFGSVEKEIVEEGKNGHEVKTVKRVNQFSHSPYAKPFDESNVSWTHGSSHTNLLFLMTQQNYLNDLLQARGHVMLNDAYDLLHMPRTQAGTVVGWVKGHGDNYIDFGLTVNSHDPVMRDFMNFENNDGVMIDFNVDGIVNNLIGKKY